MKVIVADHIINSIVENKVNFTKHPSNTSVNEQDLVELQCGISDSSTEILWQKDGALLGNSTRVRILAHGSLMIQEVQCNDAGSYLCFVRSSVTYHNDGSYICSSTNITSTEAILNVTCHGE